MSIAVVLVQSLDPDPNLIEVKGLGQSSSIKLPRSWISYPTLPFPCWISICSPDWVRGAIQVICSIRKSCSIRAMNTRAIRERVVWGTQFIVISFAPGRRVWIQYHLTVTCNVRSDITITWPTIVLPAAPNINKDSGIHQKNQS